MGLSQRRDESTLIAALFDTDPQENPVDSADFAGFDSVDFNGFVDALSGSRELRGRIRYSVSVGSVY